MANNRMFLRCKECGKYVCLGKYYPSTGWYTVSALEKEKFNEWLDGHWNDGKHSWTEEMFEIVYESDDRVTSIDVTNKVIEVKEHGNE